MAETHEFALDKITYILQELLSGFIGITFDLSVTAGEITVTINNSGGTDAVMQPWVSGETAGVFHGEITTNAPVDGEDSTKADGYIYIEVFDSNE